VLEIRNLTRRFGGVTAVDRVSLTVTRGEIRSIIGPNGAGKSTVLALISGGLVPSSGEVRFNERSLKHLSPAEVFHLGIVRSFQVPHVFPKLSVCANVRLLAASRVLGTGSPFSRLGSKRAEVNHTVAVSLDRVGLADRANEPVGTLAHGDQRLVEIAMAISAKPDLLLLDEPTAGMSPAETHRTTALLQELAPAITLIIVEHDMNLVMRISDRISVLDRGRLLVEGTPADIRQNADVQAAYLG
jgi:branched-chain amino acid transport system ATP-binding protein